MINGNLLNLLSVLNLHYEKMYSVQSNIAQFFVVGLRNKYVRIVQHPASDEQFSNYQMAFFITNYIRNHVIKYYQYFSFLPWIVLFNAIIDTLHIAQVFNQWLWIFKKFKGNFFTFVNQQLILWLIWTLAYKKKFISIWLDIYQIKQCVCFS